MSAAPEVNVERVIDEAPLRAFQLLIAVISAVVILIENRHRNPPASGNARYPAKNQVNT